jgi:hydroxypyruvate reductase
VIPTATLRRDAAALAGAALAGADAGAAVTRHLSVDRDVVRLGPLTRPLREIDRLVVLGAGKAAAMMAAAAERCLGDQVRGGLIVVPHGTPATTRRVRALPAGHPLPDADGLAATEALLEVAADLGERDHALVLVSGGASAMLVAPPSPLGLHELRATTLALLRSGADIHDMNTVRRHLSRVGGGWLAAILHPCPSWTMVLSDVIGDDLSAVGSGPTLPDATTFGHALAVIDRYDLRRVLPAAVIEHLEAGHAGRVEETPKPGNPWFHIAQAGLAGSVAHAVDAAQREALRRGYQADVESVHLQGEARAVGAQLARSALTLQRDLKRAAVVLFGGETTVTMTGAGRGGRNQELALAAAGVLDGHPGVTLLALATDGTDGDSDAAGAIVDGGTAARLRARGVDLLAALADNDSHPALDAAGELLRTGPTGTNTMDVIAVLVSPR